MTETLANGYSSESVQRELSNECQHERVWMVYKNLCILVLWTKVASALEGLKESIEKSPSPSKYTINHMQKAHDPFITLLLLTLAIMYACCVPAVIEQQQPVMLHAVSRSQHVTTHS